MKKQVIRVFFMCLPYLLSFYLGNRVGVACLITGDFFQAVVDLPKLIATAPFHGFLSTTGLLGGGAAGFIVKLAATTSIFYHRKVRDGREYGSASWGGTQDIAPYINRNFSENILFTKTERLTMESRPKNPALARNKNALIIGGSGSGKTRFFVKPNLMQMHSSYVVTDPKGSLMVECGQLLQRGKYRLKVLNTIDFSSSMHYNPFAYLRKEEDILRLVETLITNTKSKDSKGGDDFWEKAETLLYCALIGYIWYEAPAGEKNFTTLVEMINLSEVRENDEGYKNPIDMVFDTLEEKNPDHFAVRQYKKYKLAAGKTAKSILISCGARLASFDIEGVRELMRDDELELDQLGEEKTALFVIISDTDSTYNFIVSMMYTQLFVRHEVAQSSVQQVSA